MITYFRNFQHWIIDRLELLDGTTRIHGLRHVSCSSHFVIVIKGPSDVDYRCQQSHEMMDKAFVGLIFSVFNFDPNDLKHAIQVHAFQGKADKQYVYFSWIATLIWYSKTCIEVVPSPVGYPVRCLERIVELQDVLIQEDKESIFLPNQKISNPLQQMYHNAEFTKRMARFIQGSCVPLKGLLQNELAQNQSKLAAMEEEEQQLLQLLKQKQK